MLLYRRTWFAAVGAVSLGMTLSGAVLAQTPSSARIRGDVTSVNAHELVVTSRTGEKLTMKLASDARATFITAISIDAIRPGSFIGTAAISQPDGTLKALEVHVFPESMRGTGEGYHPWDTGADSTMTNGTVGDLKVANGRYLTVTYKGGEQKVFVPENAPIVTFEPATMADVKTGDHVIVTATHNADETLTATRISVGKNGLIPPM
jgi:hypothetical protein